MKSLHTIELENDLQDQRLKNTELLNEIEELKARLANQKKFFSQLEDSMYVRAKFLFFGRKEQ